MENDPTLPRFNRMSDERIINVLDDVSSRLSKDLPTWFFAQKSDDPTSKDYLPPEEMEKLSRLIIRDIEVLHGAISEMQTEGEHGYIGSRKKLLDSESHKYVYESINKMRHNLWLKTFLEKATLTDAERETLKDFPKELNRVFGPL